MTIGLVRIRAERLYNSMPESPHAAAIHGGPNPSHRVIDVPRDQAATIVDWYKRSGWDVTTEDI